MAIFQKVLRLLPGYITIAAFYLAGIVIQQFLSMPIPGAIVGILLLFLCLTVTDGIIPESTLDAASQLISIMALLLLPASVSIFFLPPELTDLLPAVLGGIVLGTLLSMCVLSLVAKRLMPAPATEHSE